jgi:galactose-1-phosphate uridylyltransferase
LRELKSHVAKLFSQINAIFATKIIQFMETISIEINNPKAKQLLQDLANMNLITIKPKQTINELLEKLRNNRTQTPSLDEISAEVEQIRLSRYAKKTADNH